MEQNKFNQIDAYLGQPKGYVKDILIVTIVIVVAAFCLVCGLAKAFGVVVDLILILVGAVALLLFFIQTTHIGYGKTMCKLVATKDKWTVEQFMQAMPKSYVKSSKDYFLLFFYNQIKDGHLANYALYGGEVIEKIEK